MPDWMEQLERLWTAVVGLLSVPLEASERVFWLYLVAALAIAYVAYLRQFADQPRSLKGFLAFCFPRKVYGHRSAINDYKITAVNHIVVVLWVVPLTAGVWLVVSESVQRATLGMGVPQLASLDPLAAGLLYALVIGIALDFGVFFAHYLSHRIPALWEFHKVHHSAEVLMPLTVYRVHPVDTLITKAFSGILTGVTDGLFRTAVGNEFSSLDPYSLNLLVLAFYFFGYNLRHSQIWVDYGPFWDRIFISPAQHQIHHSQDPRHHDRNMGFMFAFWDRLFGTLYVPRGREELTYGLHDEREHEEFHSVWAMYVRPFQQLGRHVRRVKPAMTVMATATIGLSVWLAPALSSTEPASVMMEELTSPEIRNLVDRGYTVAIVPTGGVEQNGAHMVVGKHNFVVRATSRRIAERLGNALVAPVIPYSPAGSLDPPTDHMRYAGSMTLPPEAFKEVLEASARSLKLHGFTMICFVGDSGWSQEPQAEVAEALTRRWVDDGVIVLQVDRYYAANGQIAWLKEEGRTDEEIGTHAGIRDTAELWHVFPEGIRDPRQASGTDAQADSTGVSGEPRLASPKVGARMIELKVQTAVNQIRDAQRRMASR